MACLLLVVKRFASEDSVGFDTDSTSPVRSGSLKNVLVNTNGSPKPTTKSSSSTSSVGIYFVEVCFERPSKKSTRLSVGRGGKSTETSLISEASEQTRETGSRCREGLMELLPSDAQYASLDNGSLSGVTTKLPVFSVSDVMTDEASSRAVYAVSKDGDDAGLGILPMSPKIGGTPSSSSSGVYDAKSYKYVCVSSGLYLFTISLRSTSATSSAAPTVELRGLPRGFQLDRRFASRTILSPCSVRSTVYLNVTAGRVVNRELYDMATFSAFPYEPRYVKSSSAWSLLKDSSSTAWIYRMESVPFNVVLYNDDDLWAPDARTVTIKTSGHYYVYFSGGVDDKICRLTIKIKRNETIFKIFMKSFPTPKIEAAGRGTVVLLKATDVLYAICDKPSFLFSLKTGYNQLSFFGMLLYSS